MAKRIKCAFNVDGMHCDSCELYIEQAIKKQPGVVSVSANSSSQIVQVSVDELTDIEELQKKLNEQIAKQGYKIVDTLQLPTKNGKALALSSLLAISIFVVFLLLQKLNITSLVSVEKLTYPSIFILGVLASLSTCMAVVGGVVMTLSSKLVAEKRGQAVLVFHASRLLGFLILGGVIGLLGKVIVITATISALLRLVIAVVMITIGLDMIGVKVPKLVFPKQIAVAFGVFEDKEGWSSALLLGVATFFLPCAFTQSMQLYAVTTGSFLQGALVMGTFALGTLPVLGLVSLGSANGAASITKGIFGYTMGILIILFALLNVFSALGTFGVIPPLSL